ncbi:MAG TPA: patatin-like phospholipase family protein [Bacteroidota bacterium]|nr:patatin-like phospholipase family protein [Bacteroidota bacterium]
MLRFPFRVALKWHLVPLAFFLSFSPAGAQQPQIIRPSVVLGKAQGIRPFTVSDSSRPKVGLVLSGGGGRGLAQIGVLRALERHHIPIDFIVGNSLGSVVGGLYASGYTTTQLESIAVHTDWSELLSFSEETKRSDLLVEQKQAQAQGYLLIRFDGLAPIIPSAISGGQRLSNYFSYLTLQALYHPSPTFDDLKIPFRATATDLNSGRRIILSRGSLAEAMRASVTVPLLFSPLERDSMSMVDGGLKSNIPADVARLAGCDVVIAVNSTSSLRKPDQMTAPWEIADQIMTIMMEESNRRELKMADVVITPGDTDRIVSDFSGIDSLIASGERAGEESIPKILGVLHSHEAEHAAPDSARYDHAIIRFDGDTLTPSLRERVLSEAEGGNLTEGTLRMALNAIMESGLYTDAYAEVSPNGSGSLIHLHVKENAPLQKCEFSGNHRIPDESISNKFRPLEGRPIDPAEVQSAFEKILDSYRNEGLSLARVESLQVDRTAGVVKFKLNEGRIKQIRYDGNEKTRDYIIRREFPLDEGDIFNIDDASQGIVNIRSTGLFDYVLLDVRYENDQPILILKVKEKSSELLRLGFHSDDERGVVTMISLGDANFRGAWEDLELSLLYGYKDRNAKLGYTINRIFNTYLSFGLSGYYLSRDITTYVDDPTLTTDHWDRLENGRYRQVKYGGGLVFGSSIERFGNLEGEMRWENHQIQGLSGLGYTPEQYRFASVKLESNFDTEDKFLFPTEGMSLSISYESALKSLGSEVSFGKFGFTYESYHTFLPRNTIRPKITFGFADQTLPVAEQYSLGGINSFFGLRQDDSRGRQIFLVNMEYRYWLPFKLIFETYLKARYDLGTISLVPQELKFSNFRHGIGFELDLDSPLGQLGIGMGKSFYFRNDLPNSPVTVGPLLLYFSLGPPI